MTMWPFGKSEDKKTLEALDRAEKRYEALVHDFDGRLRSEQVERQRTETELAKANAKIAEIQQQVRAQTEADLYFASAKIMRDIMETGKHSQEDRNRQAALLQSYQMRNQQNQGLGQLGGMAYNQYLQGLVGIGGG